MATGYDVSGLSAFTKDSAEKKSYLYKMLATGDSIKLFPKQTGVKSSERIHLISNSPVWQAQACSFTASANTAFTDRTLTVGKPGIYMKWCEKDLESKYTQLCMQAGSKLETLTFAEQIVGDIMQQTARDIDAAIWKGNTLSTDQQLLHFDGLQKIIAAASIGYTATPAVWSVANARTIMQTFVGGLTDDMLAQKSGKIFMGTAEYRDYRMKLTIDNLYHNAGDSTKAEGTDIEIVPVLGLSGTKAIYFMPTDYTIIGTDLEGEEENYELFYAKEAREIRFIAEWKMGVQIAFPSLIGKMLNT